MRTSVYAVAILCLVVVCNGCVSGFGGDGGEGGADPFATCEPHPSTENSISCYRASAECCDSALDIEDLSEKCKAATNGMMPYVVLCGDPPVDPGPAGNTCVSIFEEHYDCAWGNSIPKCCN